MGKRVDHDATQDVSASMLVDRPKPPVYPKVPTNDASMWMQTPVSVDDFVSGPKKRPRAPRSGRGVMVAVMVTLFVGVAGVGVWYALLRERPKETSPYAASGSGSAAAKPAVATDVADAAVAVAAADAGVAAVDAAVSPAVTALNADAVSGADPAVKKTTKKRAATKKKTTAKKKTATAPKKKRR
jgi:hypothetical protein